MLGGLSRGLAFTSDPTALGRSDEQVRQCHDLVLHLSVRGLLLVGLGTLVVGRGQGKEEETKEEGHKEEVTVDVEMGGGIETNEEKEKVEEKVEEKEEERSPIMARWIVLFGTEGKLECEDSVVFLQMRSHRVCSRSLIPIWATTHQALITCHAWLGGGPPWKASTCHIERTFEIPPGPV